MNATSSKKTNVLASRLKRVARKISGRSAREYPSETSKRRARLAPFCIGYGADLGFGGDPIIASAIRVDSPSPYADTGNNTVQLGGDAARLHWFANGVLDYLYSSHLLEDFADTETVLREWIRV